MPKLFQFDSQILFQKHVFLPNQHGSWAMWLGPLLIGIGTGGVLSWPVLWVTLAVLGVFLAVQPLTVLVKVFAGRKNKNQRPAAWFWTVVYLLITLIGAVGLAISEQWLVVGIGALAVPVLISYLWLVARRAERGHMLGEIFWSGALALAAPAAYWVNGGALETGWWLWILCCVQSAGAIVYSFLRFKHRRMKAVPDVRSRWSMAMPTLLFQFGTLTGAWLLIQSGWIPAGVITAFGLLFLEIVHGAVIRPGIGSRPASIGIRQVVMTIVFVGFVIVAYQ
jgi:hypothetical protein